MKGFGVQGSADGPMGQNAHSENKDLDLISEHPPKDPGMTETG